jgi:protein-tyrosine-phosphatase
MAEGFARTYGKDVIEAASAGLAPAMTIAPLTALAMAEKNISLESHYSKGFDAFPTPDFDVIVNMSGQPLPDQLGPVILTWPVGDPIGHPLDTHRTVAADIETRVMGLILALRAGRTPR